MEEFDMRDLERAMAIAAKDGDLGKAQELWQLHSAHEVNVLNEVVNSTQLTGEALKITEEHVEIVIAENEADDISADGMRFMDEDATNSIAEARMHATQRAHELALVAVISAAETGQLNIVKWVFGEKLIDPSFSIRCGWTPLFKAIFTGKLELVEWLVVCAGVDVTMVDSVSGRTALMYAASMGHTHIVQWLASRSDISYVGRRGETALLCAAFHFHYTTVQYILEAGESVSLSLWEALLEREPLDATFVYENLRFADHPRPSKLLCTMLLSGPAPKEVALAKNVDAKFFTRTCEHASKLRARLPKWLEHKSSILSLLPLPASLVSLIKNLSTPSTDEIWSVPLGVLLWKQRTGKRRNPERAARKKRAC